MNLNGMQVIVLSQPGLQNEQLAPRSIRPRLATQLIGLGVAHILNSVFCMIVQIIGLVKYDSEIGGRYGPRFGLVMLGHGLWSGLLFLITGIIGIAAGTRKSSCQVISFIILSIISAGLSCIMIIVAALSVRIIYSTSCGMYDWDCTNDTYTKQTTLLVLESILAALGILEGIIAIWSSVVCCLVGVCSCCSTSPPQTQQPMILSAEQQAALMSNPMFLPNQQQSTVGFYPQQQTAQFNKLRTNAPPYVANNYLPAGTGEGFYTGLNTGMRRSLPSVNMDAAAGNTTSVYEELHEYDEIIS